VLWASWSPLTWIGCGPRRDCSDINKILAPYDASDYLPKHQNLIWLGGTGCGKTGLATSANPP
jgi:DNA replication protein DnaC